MDNQSSRRILEFFLYLLHGEKFDFQTWTNLENNRGKSERAYQRDLNIIRETLKLCNDSHELQLKDDKQQLLSASKDKTLARDIVLAQILLASRALTKDELLEIIADITHSLTPQEKKKFDSAIKMAKGSYLPIYGANPLFDKIKVISQAIADQTLLTFHYTNSKGDKNKAYRAYPLALFFDVSYFYVIMQVEGYKNYSHYRLDRIETIDYKDSEKPEKLNTSFSLQDYRKEVYLLQMGRKVTFNFKSWIYWGTVKDKFPTAKRLAQLEDGGDLIQVTSYEKGALLWLLGQGPDVQVVSPKSFVDKVHERLAKTMELYDNN